MQRFDGKPGGAMKRMIEQRVRFYPSLSAAIQSADEIYERKKVSEAQLKALSIAASGGTQWACGSCGEHRKAEAIVVAELGMDEATVRERLTVKGQTGGKRLLKVRYLPGRAGLIQDAMASGLLGPGDKLWASVAVGLWSVPLLYKLADGRHYYANDEDRKRWIQNEPLQAVGVAQIVDEFMEAGTWNFNDIARKFGAYIEHEKPDVYAFQAVGIFNRLIASGHTAEV